MNKLLVLKGKKTNKMEHAGAPLSYDEIKRRQQKIEDCQVEAFSNISGMSLNILNKLF